MNLISAINQRSKIAAATFAQRSKIAAAAYAQRSKIAAVIVTALFVFAGAFVLPSPANAQPTPQTPRSSQEHADTSQERPLVTVLHLKPAVKQVAFFDEPNGKEVPLIDFDRVGNTKKELTLFEAYNQNDFQKGLLPERKIVLVAEEFDETGQWALVQVPVRPNTTKLWVQTKDFNKWLHRFYIEIDLTERSLSFYNGEETLITNEPVVIGRESRRTPLDRSYITGFFQDETLPELYGKAIITTATYSNDLSTYGAGLPKKFNLHGTNKPELVGEAVTSGDIRLREEALTTILDKAPLGTIIDIKPGDNPPGGTKPRH